MLPVLDNIIMSQVSGSDFENNEKNIVGVAKVESRATIIYIMDLTQRWILVKPLKLSRLILLKYLILLKWFNKLETSFRSIVSEPKHHNKLESNHFQIHVEQFS